MDYVLFKRLQLLDGRFDEFVALAEALYLLYLGDDL